MNGHGAHPQHLSWENGVSLVDAGSTHPSTVRGGLESHHSTEWTFQSHMTAHSSPQSEWICIHLQSHTPPFTKVEWLVLWCLMYTMCHEYLQGWQKLVNWWGSQHEKCLHSACWSLCTADFNKSNNDWRSLSKNFLPTSQEGPPLTALADLTNHVVLSKPSKFNLLLHFSI